MLRYYVNKKPQSSGEHEVHTDGCSYMPDKNNREALGFFSSCKPAVQEAEERYRNVDGCGHCCKACHRK